MDIKSDNPKSKYDIICQIGCGTFGNVYKATHHNTGKAYALKSIKIENEDDYEGIKNEIDILDKCRHKNIICIYEAFRCRSLLWICLELGEGGSLQDVILAIGSLPELMIAYVVREAVRGLEYMHSCDQIHRDIKGANILLTTNGEIKLADFGVSARISRSAAKRKSILGTPYWMAPEVITAERQGGYGKSCDIWSMAITTIELADREPPHYDLHPIAALHLISKSSYRIPTVKEPSKWSSGMNSFIKKSLNKNVRFRPTASDCLNYHFLKNPSLSIQCGAALYKAQLSRQLRNRHAEMPLGEQDEALLELLKKDALKDLVKDMPKLDTIVYPQETDMPEFSDTIKNLDFVQIHVSEEPPIRKDSGLCYIWDWRKQIKLTESVGIPKTPCVEMGAGLTKIYEDCLLDILCTELWISSSTCEQNLLMGTNDGLYLANLSILGEFNPEKIFNKPCTWLHMNMYDVIVVLTSSGKTGPGAQLYTIDMMDLTRVISEPKSSKFTEMFNFSKHRNGRVYTKVDETKDIEKCLAFRSPHNNDDFLMCSMPDRIILMQWYLPYRKYMLIKLIGVSIPRSLMAINEPLMCPTDTYPYLCFGVGPVRGPGGRSKLEFDYVDMNLHTGWGLVRDKTSDLKGVYNKMEAIFVGQLTNNTVVVGFRDWAGVYDLEGNLSNQHILNFAMQVDDYVIISNGLLAIHRHGVVGKNYSDQVIQNISDPSREFTLLGSKGFLVLKTEDTRGNKELHVLTGYENMT